MNSKMILGLACLAVMLSVAYATDIVPVTVGQNATTDDKKNAVSQTISSCLGGLTSLISFGGVGALVIALKALLEYVLTVIVGLVVVIVNAVVTFLALVCSLVIKFLTKLIETAEELLKQLSNALAVVLLVLLSIDLKLNGLIETVYKCCKAIAP